MGGDADGSPKFIDAVNGATTSLAKGKIGPGIQRLNTKVRQNRADNSLCVRAAQIVIKGDMDDAVHTQTAQKPVFFHPVDQVKGCVILPEKFSRMGVKSDYSRCKTMCLCGFDCGANHLLMALVNTIKIANRGAHRTVGQWRIAD